MATNVFPEERPDRLEEACAVFGVYAPGEDVARLTCFGLQALQHRGQESAGIAVGDGETILIHKDLGLVDQVFDEETLSHLAGDIAIGHTRYSTAGGGGWTAAQPHVSAIDDELIALAHNGTLVDTKPQRAWLANEGVQLYSHTDSEVAARTIGVDTRRTGHIRSGIRLMMQQLHGAYAIVLVTPTALYAFRDPNGIRPLSLGRLPGNRGWVVASETCGLDAIGADFVRDIEPGEILKVSADGVESEQGVAPSRRASCIFEYVYFARPDSIIDGEVVYHARRRMGRILAGEAPADADLVLGVPDSGIPPAIGYAERSGIPYADAIVKNRYVGRTFIQPTQEMRQMGIRIKLNPLPSLIRGKRLVVIDDSIVRGNTSKRLVAMLRAAGAAEVHLRIVSPEVLWPCFYGIDTDTQDQLISANMTHDDVCTYIGCDSLAFISLAGLHRAVRADHAGFCDACFSGDYPTPIPESLKRKGFLPGNESEDVPSTHFASATHAKE
ncbi:MAG: amidophosphoribosyltransferase [Coriobacteriaceae bacterium]|nr:amidophosphoribosyltransferase [Coriobacteriaceae bacterium]